MRSSGETKLPDFGVVLMLVELGQLRPIFTFWYFTLITIKKKNTSTVTSEEDCMKIQSDTLTTNS